jgi:hypothetical protein
MLPNNLFFELECLIAYLILLAVFLSELLLSPNRKKYSVGTQINIDPMNTDFRQISKETFAAKSFSIKKINKKSPNFRPNGKFGLAFIA